jgi:hypothetical protein
MDLWRAVAVRSEHGRNGLAAGFPLRNAWYTLNDTRLFHERRVEFRRDCHHVSIVRLKKSVSHTSTDHRTIIAREARIRWGC